MRITFTIALILFCKSLLAQVTNDLPCNAIDLGVLSIGNSLVLNNQSNMGAGGENTPWYNAGDNTFSCKGTSVYNNTVYYYFQFDDFINGATVSIIPTSGTLDAILLDADNCADLINPPAVGTDEGRWYVGDIGSSCNTGVGDTIKLGGVNCFQPSDDKVYLMVASDFGGGTFNIRVDPVNPTGCDGCINGPETIVDGPHPISFNNPGEQISLCRGDNVRIEAPPTQGVGSYSWERVVNGQRTLFSTSDPVWVTTLPGTYQFTASDGCTDYTSNQIEVLLKDTLSAEKIMVDGNLEFCEGDSLALSLNNTPNTSFKWFQNNISLSQPQASIVIRQSGDYYAIASNECDIDTSETVTVQVRAAEAPPVVSGQSICEGEIAELGQTGDYLWFADIQGNMMLPSDNGILKTSPMLMDTIFFVAQSNDANCLSDLVPVRFQVSPLPDITVSQDTIIRIGETIQLMADGGDVYQWIPEDYLSDAFIANPLSRPLQSISYMVSVTTSEGCTAAASVNIEVIGDIRIANAFTPNGDGINDQWKIEFIESSPQAQVKIFNRYGMEVFHASGNIEPWDGFYRGEQLPPDTYFYQIVLKEDSKPITGYIDLLK